MKEYRVIIYNETHCDFVNVLESVWSYADTIANEQEDPVGQPHKGRMETFTETPVFVDEHDDLEHVKPTMTFC